MKENRSTRIFYGWWIVAAAFLNLFFAVGIIFYGFPVFYPSFVESLSFARAQVTQGFLLGFLIVGLPFGFVAGALIDRIGSRWIILAGAGLIGVSLFLMAFMTRFWQYELLCITEVLGFVLAGPIANQVLIAHWFRVQRGRAMGFAYLGLGFGGVISPILVSRLIRIFGWRRALGTVGVLILIVLFPIGILLTRSTPAEMGLQPDGDSKNDLADDKVAVGAAASSGVAAAARTVNFWLILAGSTLVIGAIGAVIQHFILFLRDQGYSSAVAARFSTVLLASSLGGRVLVGYLADRFSKKGIMALFYLLIGLTIPILYMSRQPAAIWFFALAFGFAMGADYMLIPLITAECFGTAALGKILALIIMGYSLGQWAAPWMAGKLFDSYHSYQLAWKILAGAGVLGAAAIYKISVVVQKGEPFLQ